MLFDERHVAEQEMGGEGEGIVGLAGGGKMVYADREQKGENEEDIGLPDGSSWTLETCE